MGYGPWGCKELDTTEKHLAHSIAQLILVLRIQGEGQVRNSNGRVRKRMVEKEEKKRREQMATDTKERLKKRKILTPKK